MKVRLWRYYNIGCGKFVKYSGTELISEVNIISKFNDVGRTGMMKESKASKTDSVPFFVMKMVVKVLLKMKKN